MESPLAACNTTDQCVVWKARFWPDAGRLLPLWDTRRRFVFSRQQVELQSATDQHDNRWFVPDDLKYASRFIVVCAKFSPLLVIGAADPVMRVSMPPDGAVELWAVTHVASLVDW